MGDELFSTKMYDLWGNIQNEFSASNLNIEKLMRNLTSPAGSNLEMRQKHLDIGSEIGFSFLATVANNNKKFNLFKLSTWDLGELGDAIGKTISDAFNNIGVAFKEGMEGTADSPRQMLIDFDDSIRKTTTNLGLSNDEAEMLSENFKKSAFELARLNFSQKDIYESQGVFNKELRNTRTLLTSEMELVAKIEKGVAFKEGGALIANLVKYGTNFKSIGTAIENTLFKSSKLGINATSVLETALNSVKESQKINFKDGVNGLIDMARQSEMLKANMSETFGMINKSRNLEGAMELSTKFQMLGKNVDALRLNFLARNDPKEFQKYMNATLSSIGTLKRATGEVEFDAIDYDILQAMSEYTGQSIENMKEQIVMQKRISQVKMMNLKLTDDEATKVANIATIEDGILKVQTKRGLVSVKDLAKDEIKSLDAIKIPLEERAKNAQGTQELLQVALKTASASILDFSDVIRNNVEVWKSFMEEQTKGLNKKTAGLDMALLSVLYKMKEDTQNTASSTKIGITGIIGNQLYDINNKSTSTTKPTTYDGMPDFSKIPNTTNSSNNDEISKSISNALDKGIDKLITELAKNKASGTTNFFESGMSKTEMKRMMNEIMSDDSKGG